MSDEKEHSEQLGPPHYEANKVGLQRESNSDESTKVKGFRLKPDTRRVYEAMRDASKSTDDEFLERLLHVAKVWEVQQSKPEFEEDVKDLQRYMGRLTTLFIRVLERGSDAVEEEKKNTETLLMQKDEDLHGLSETITTILKREQEREILLAQLQKDKAELQDKYDQLIKGTKTMDELLDALRGETVRLKEELDVAQSKASSFDELKERFSELEQSSKEELNAAQRRAIESEQQMDRAREDHEKEVKKLHAELSSLHEKHKEDLEIQAKEKDIEKRQEIVHIREEHQSKIMHLTEEYNAKTRELYERLDQKEKGNG
jgi:DNA repair exonuclease SbcCD ATPase subunit